MNLRGAIFDFDGTLYDSMAIWEDLGADYLRSLGKEPASDLREQLRTMSLDQSAIYLNERYALHLSKEAIIQGINDQIRSYYVSKVLPKAHVRDFLQELKEAHVKMVIATATDKPLIESALERCGLTTYFSEILTCSGVGFGKDQPMIYQKALESLETIKSETLVFEDAFHAAQTAKSAGFVVCGVYDAFEPKQEELKSLADYYLIDFSQFLNKKLREEF